MKLKTSKNVQEQKIIQEITKYVLKMCKRYYSALFYEIDKYKSVWSYISGFYLEHPSPLFTNFVEQVVKCHFDQMTLLKTQSRKNEEYVQMGENELKKFMNNFFPIYGKIATVENYSSLINILTYLEYGSWSQEEYSKSKQFLIHCFNSLTGTK